VGETALVGSLSHLDADFRGQHHPVTAALEDAAQDLLGSTGVVHVGGVDEVDAPLQAVVHHLRGGCFVRLGAERHGAERDARHGQGCFSQGSLFHGQAPLAAGFSRQ
jgi:hypothetical protein